MDLSVVYSFLIVQFGALSQTGTVCVVEVFQLLRNTIYMLRKVAHWDSFYTWKIWRATFTFLKNRVDQAFVMTVLFRVVFEVFEIISDIVALRVWRA